MIIDSHPIPERIASFFVSNHLVYVALGWVALFFAGPIAILLYTSLNVDGQVLLDAYYRAIHPPYRGAFIRSFYYALLTTIFTVVVAFILAYYAARISKRSKMMVSLILGPLWIAYIIRYFGLLLFLSPAGPVSTITGYDFNILFTTSAVIIAFINVFIPFAALPIYNSLNSINQELVHASRIQGAGKMKTLWKIIIPLSLQGIVTAGILVFILTAGSYLGPSLVGGPDQSMIANLITSAYLDARNIQLASAISMVYTGILITIIILLNNFVDLQEVFEGI